MREGGRGVWGGGGWGEEEGMGVGRGGAEGDVEKKEGEREGRRERRGGQERGEGNSRTLQQHQEDPLLQGCTHYNNLSQCSLDSQGRIQSSRSVVQRSQG